MESYAMNVIARIESGFASKFGVPRQSGLVNELRARVIFEPPYRNRDAVRGLDGFSHIWLLWAFDRATRPDGATSNGAAHTGGAKSNGAARPDWSPTVRPPRLGGNRRVGVFATRSPFRPNPIGLSCVELERVELETPQGPTLHIRGADLVDGTPIFDIKPYLAYTDAHADAVSGYASDAPRETLQVDIPLSLLSRVPDADRAALIAVLAHDPRPRYQDDPGRVYGFGFAGLEVKFRVAGERLEVTDIITA
ncbi:MAG: tRNA (N6-threonylcarbamoyladenosine(37)-N6)-methyltransferase TrmO [Oscillibacter sp.]|nr:tRNA (N6-threonylcarbamoyladenosine(37)-N6)-methyltransferase TrmO [Oscillibacter sp.]